MIDIRPGAPRCANPYAAALPAAGSAHSAGANQNMGMGMDAGQSAGAGMAAGHAAGMHTAAGQSAGMGTAAGQTAGMHTAAGQSAGMGMAAGQTMDMNTAAGQSAAAWNGGMETEIAPDYGATDENGLTNLPQEDFNTHLSADEAARNSWRALLARNVGRNVIVSFLLGTQNTVTAEGELFEVGTDYLVIYQPAWESHITADLYSVKFVEFREPPRSDMR